MQNDSVQRIFIKKCFLFTVGSVYLVKRFKTEWRTFCWWRRDWNGGEEVAETTVKRFLCCGFRRITQEIRQANQCWWRICGEINVFPGSLSICGQFTDSPSHMCNLEILEYHSGHCKNKCLLSVPPYWLRFLSTYWRNSSTLNMEIKFSSEPSVSVTICETI
jgi:hypothetical protein